MNAGNRLRIPGATYRLQLNRGFTFAQAEEITGYLSEFGITDVYLSPVFTAPPESNHGYDVCDYNQFNPVLGGISGWKKLTEKLRQQGLGLLLDFVPNHMGAVPQYNPWWRDVLEFGVESAYARHFDIDWNPPDPSLKNRVLLPILEDELEKVAAQGLFVLFVTPQGLQINYRNTPLPIHPRSYREILDRILEEEDKKAPALQSLFELLPNENEPLDRAKFDQAKQLLTGERLSQTVAQRLKGINENIKNPAVVEWLNSVLDQQAYRLEYWKTGTKHANYRRFFDIDGLIGVNMDLPETFAAAHQLLNQCVSSGEVTGIRLDHIDGLADPAGYLENLQNLLANKNENEKVKGKQNFYILAEKILMQDERLRSDWPIFGTTGYEFTALAVQVFIDSVQCSAVTDIYNSFVPGQPSLDEIISRNKRQVMDLGLSREIAVLSRLFKNCADEVPAARDFSESELTLAIRAVMVQLPVYRTYIVPGRKIASADKEVIEGASKLARSVDPTINPKATDFLMNTLMFESPSSASRDIFRRRFQQFSGPIMAKSFEDTTFFVYNRLIALNEVGGNPGQFGRSPAEFHELNLRRLKDEPHTMLTTSTHDTKLSEDARTRVAAISEVPELWREFLRVARSSNAQFKTDCDGRLAPDANEEYLLYQILLASWPLEPMSAGAIDDYAKRIQRHMLKAMREGKINTRWDSKNEVWENAVSSFVEKVLHQPAEEYSMAFESLSKTIAELGAINSLSQTLLKLTVPGVPDIYQGNELWQFCLTDPDNRQPIDFVERQKILKTIKETTPALLMKNWRNGGIKMFLTHAILCFRQANAELFKHGDYHPLTFSGEFQESCLGFARVLNGKSTVIIVPRISARVGFPPIGSRWNPTLADLSNFKCDQWTNVFTGEILTGSKVSLARIFREIPFAILCTVNNTKG